jgi:hypothetical protein
VSAILGTSFDPLDQSVFLPLGQQLLEIGGRHSLGGIDAENPIYELAGLGLARNDRFTVDGRFAHVQPQISLARRRVGTVTSVAVVSQNRLDITPKIDLFLAMTKQSWCE